MRRGGGHEVTHVAPSSPFITWQIGHEAERPPPHAMKHMHLLGAFAWCIRLAHLLGAPLAPLGALDLSSVLLPHFFEPPLLGQPQPPQGPGVGLPQGRQLGLLKCGYRQKI